MTLIREVINEYILEEETDVITLRIYLKDDKRIASCQLVATGLDSVRVKNLNSIDHDINPSLIRAICIWLSKKNYKTITYERKVKNGFVEKTYPLERILKLCHL